VQNKIRQVAEEQLSEKLGVDVTIGDLGIRPFNRAMLRDVALVNEGDTLARISRLGAGVNLYDLVIHSHVTVNYAELRGLDARLHRATADSPLNIQPIIDALSKKDPNKPPTKFDVRVNTVVIRSSKISYDIDSAPRLGGRFDRNHIAISDLRADVNIPRIKNDDFDFDLKRLDFKEQSGLTVSNLTGHVLLSDKRLAWQGLELSMPASHLLISNGSLRLNGLNSIAKSLADRGVSLAIKRGSHVYLPDLAPLYPDLAGIRRTATLELSARASTERVDISSLRLRLPDQLLRVDVEDAVVINPLQRESFSAELPKLHLALETSLLEYLHHPSLNAKLLGRLPDRAVVDASASLNRLSGELSGKLTMDDSTVDLNADYSRRDTVAPYALNFVAETDNFNLGKLLDNADFGRVTGSVNAKATVAKRLLTASADVAVRDFDYRRHRYDEVQVSANLDGDDFDLTATMADDGGSISLSGEGVLDKDWPELIAHLDVDDLDLYALNLTNKYPGHKLSSTVDVDFAGKSPDRGDGEFLITNLQFERPDGESLLIDRFDITTTSAEAPRQIEVSSDFLNGSFEGDFSFASLVPEVKQILARTFPKMLPTEANTSAHLANNKFTFSLTLSDTEAYSDFLHLPVSAIYPVTIDGYVDGDVDYAQVVVDAPYLRQKNKLIENTNFVAVLDGGNAVDQLYLTTRVPAKQGPTDLTVHATATDDIVDTSIDFKIDRPELYAGTIDFTTTLSRDDENRPAADVAIHRSEVAFNDSVWVVSPSYVSMANGVIDVSNFALGRDSQYVRINGRVSAEPDDLLTVDVLNLNLDYIFEAIGINNVMLGGDATGVITASSLLSSEPRIMTDGINVKNISYNKCVFGDAIVKSSFDVDDKAVVIDGTINQFNGRTAKVEGKIYAFNESLDLNLTCDETPVGFMGYYMSAFASDVTGKGSGKAHLYGTFHDIDMTGDVYVEDLRLKLNFTNTYFTASDSIHMRPGLISLKNIKLSDIYGNSATLNGELRHDYFRDPVFNFAITNAKKLLVYDETSKRNPDWYGRIFANGGATVDGRPGVVKIGADVSTAPGSTFTFVLSEREDADEYTFITFRDKAQLETKQEQPKEDAEMSLVNRLREMMARNQSSTTSEYIIELKVDITPDAEIDLVMDPVAGDKIRSNGSGNMRMVYTSADNDLQIFGKYTLDKGYYNFTLQDIIIKDFTISEGSSISFTGDPLAARLDINASYALNANLSDLDESFLQDKDLNRTNVPVHALLKVTGDIQQPEIGFDLEFPTLTSDIDRKVRSIINTEEMMNRQIIYLLALNRFYTPDYMSTTKGSELFSVASSTIASQLSSMLGQLSDKWAIAPNFRSDRGDFSDVEVDLALSSRLLNNRLLLNGNFGYRDKSLNTSQFIGDFDLEYLLNREGSVRLKAYNRYNDQNYYLRTAATTQGVGVMFKRDFDNIFSVLRRRRKAETDTVAPAVVEPLPTDTIIAPAE
jgi:hypothetical protein